ncbi:MAG: hypothetical protein CME98_22255 [Hyphomonas sp.]|nr:hypothetical protein [Hyphomonas sp.]
MFGETLETQQVVQQGLVVFLMVALLYKIKYYIHQLVQEMLEEQRCMILILDKKLCHIHLQQDM